MRALITRPGVDGPVLVETAPAPLGATDIRIAVAATSVNPLDVHLASDAGRAVFGITRDTGLGNDLTGTVVEVGADVTAFRTGDRVAALQRDAAAPVRTHAESVVVPAADAAPVPDGLDLVETASVPINAMAADQGLRALGDADGRRLLVAGAAGAVGGFALPLAVRAGWQVTALARATDEEFVRRAGAAELVTALPEAAFDAVLDAAFSMGVAFGAVRDAGAYVGFPAPAVQPERGVEVHHVVTQPDGAALAELLRLTAEGVLQPRVAGRLPLADAASAYEKVAGGGQRGRWLLLP
ncbi:alcohol dehydrogenase catalytic domain-containing protein [Nocardioides humi]|uniref:NADP-dependent oxidoreductase n=1 Tax=Nocardioides humi TaxID=449461 RepID=A0ABN2BHE5_9ACTN|nr:zinc-binding dehydrogenase [Nocardioides humi]